MLHCAQVSHVFENYGSGLRTITFLHGGKDRLFWAGHYGSKIAGACVYVKIPTNVCTLTFKCKEALLKQAEESKKKENSD